MQRSRDLLDALNSAGDYEPLINDPSLASYHCAKIIREAILFQDSLDDDHELAIFIAQFGGSQFQVLDIGFNNPHYVVFRGTVSGQNAVLLQHFSQVSFLMVSQRKPDPLKPARRIGFSDIPEQGK